MASWIRNFDTGSFTANWHLRLDYTLNSQSVSGNYSNITLNLYTYSDSGSYSQHGTWAPRIYINGGQVAGSTSVQTIAGSTPVLMASWTGNVGHNSDGTLTISIGDFLNAPANEANENQINWTLPTIPRYANITSFNINDTTDEWIEFEWTSDVACDYMSWWSTEYDGATHHDTPTSGTSWTIDLHNLKSGTTYDITVAVRNAASGLWTTSSTQYTTTLLQNHFIRPRVL